MLVEFTAKNTKLSFLLESSRVVAVEYLYPENKHVVITLENKIQFTVVQDYEEVKKRLGLSITPRAETIAI